MGGSHGASEDSGRRGRALFAGTRLAGVKPRRTGEAMRAGLFGAARFAGVKPRRAGEAMRAGVPSGTFDYWTQQVKQSVGCELERAGLFPPSRYFRCRG